MYGGELGYAYQSRRVPIAEYGPRLALPVITFSLGNYWDHYYRGRNFYHERNDWERRWQDNRGGHEWHGNDYRERYRNGTDDHRNDYRNDHRNDYRNDNRNDYRNDNRNDIAGGNRQTRSTATCTATGRAATRRTRGPPTSAARRPTSTTAPVTSSSVQR